MRVEDYLKEEGIKKYMDWSAKIEHYLLMCNYYLFFLQRIQEFDGELFGIYIEGSFWNLTKFTYFEMFVVRFCSLLDQDDKNSITLPRFYNFIKQNALNKKLREQFDSFFDVDELAKLMIEVDKLSEIRNKLIAHLDKAHLIGNLQNKIKYPTSIELRKMNDKAVEYYNNMSFTPSSGFWLTGYSDYWRDNHRTDIDKYLDLIAMNSPIIARSQDHPEIWGIHRPGLSDAQIAKINEVRRKMGLPDVE